MDRVSRWIGIGWSAFWKWGVPALAAFHDLLSIIDRFR